MNDAALIKASGLKTWFPVHRGILRRVSGYVKAVNDVSIEIHPGKIVSVVGESGCGKSTLAYSLLGLTMPTAGTIQFEDNLIIISQMRSWKPFRKDYQIIFQDPYTSLNPRHTVFKILSEPLLIHGICKRSEIRARVGALLQQVGLSQDSMDRFPHAFSGGQRLRISIARAISLQPKLIICDEVVAALDVSVQAQILRLLMELKTALKLSLLFISHDLAVVKAISDIVHVMYLGKIVESANAQQIFTSPKHPYTQALLDAIPTLDTTGKKRPKILGGDIPSPINLPQGCTFAGRCPKVSSICKEEYPAVSVIENRSWTCHNV